MNLAGFVMIYLSWLEHNLRLSLTCLCLVCLRLSLLVVFLMIFLLMTLLSRFVLVGASLLMNWSSLLSGLILMSWLNLMKLIRSQLSPLKMLPPNLPLNPLTKKWFDMLERIDENAFAQALFNCFVDTINFK